MEPVFRSQESVITPGVGTVSSGDRLPAALRLGRVQLQVGDLTRSLEFYRDRLGFAELGRDGGSATVGTAGVPLIELVERPGAKPVPRRGRLGLYHVAILLPDQASLGRFLIHQDGAGTRLGASDHLVSEALYLTDPDGLGLEVYRDRPREAWRTVPTPAGSELAMTTTPLDVDSLMAESGGVPWGGMPAGTTIGHVHLSVGNLADAARFYRDGLGLDVTVSGYPGALFLAAGGYHHHLGLNTWAGPAAGPAAADEARLLEWTVDLPSAADVEVVSGRFRRLGIEPAGVPNGIRVTDPWGTPVRIISAAPRHS